MSKKINCSFIMDVWDFESIDFYFGTTLEGIEENPLFTKTFPTTGSLQKGDIQLELSDENLAALTNEFFIEAKLNINNDENIKAFTRKIRKKQLFTYGDIILSTVDYADTTINFYLGESSFVQYNYDENYNKPSINDNILQGNKTSLDLGIEESNWYYVDDYIINNTYPIKNNKIFAGWFTDETLETPYTETTGMAYAYFIDKEVVNIKTQQASNAIRFISTITEPMLNSLDKLYFNINGVLGQDKIIDERIEVQNIYTTINVDGQNMTPQEVGYPEESKYFITCTISDLSYEIQPILLSSFIIYTYLNNSLEVNSSNYFKTIRLNEEGQLSIISKSLEKEIIDQDMFNYINVNKINKIDLQEESSIIKNTIKGNSITINDSSNCQLEELTINGKSTQDGTPTIDNPISIVDITTEEIEITNGTDTQSAELNLTLKGIPVSSGGNYIDNNNQQWICDTIEKYADGSGKYIQRMVKVVFDGSETWTDYSSPIVYANVKSLISDTPDLIDSLTQAETTLFTLTNDVKSYATIVNDNDNSYMLKGNRLYFSPTVNGNRLNAQQFKTYLAMNGGAEILVALQTPIETPLTVEQLAELNLSTYKPITNIISNTDVEVTYIADAKTYIDNKFIEFQNTIVSQIIEQPIEEETAIEE